MDIASVVATTLKRLFPGVPVNRETQADGSFTMPSFFVSELETQATSKPNEEQMRRYNFNVVYLLDPNGPQAEQNALAKDVILSQMDYLTDESGKELYKTKGLTTDINDGDLSISFYVQVRMQKEAGAPFDEGQMTHTEGLKDG